VRARARPARRSATALAAVAALALSACGGEAGDLLALEASGGPQEEPLRLTVTEDGRGTCDRGELGMAGPLEPIPSARLIEAREVERELEGLAQDGAAFTGEDDAAASGSAQEAQPDGAGVRRYVARTRAGTVRWVEGAPELPEILPRAALLAEQLEDDLCGP
jgi:hypothetical protein